jgi:uncharacterized RDD family membrane protein YckC
MQIYIIRNGQRVGPFSIEETNRQLAAGTLNPSDQAWSEGSPGWKPLLSFAGVIVPGGASSTAALISIATPIAPPPPHYAGFWIRVLAYLIDCAFLTIVCAVPARILLSRTSSEASNIPTVEAIIWIAINFAYWAILWSSPMQATLGQAICRLKVVHARSGDRISFGRAAIRSFALLLAIAIVFIGVAMIALSERKRGLHDMLADTYVVRNR